MCQHVCLEVSSLCGCVFTLLAAELLFTNMNKNVLFQLSSAAGRVGTHGASEAHMGHLWVFSPSFFILVWDVRGIFYSSVKNWLPLFVYLPWF